MTSISPNDFYIALNQHVANPTLTSIGEVHKLVKTILAQNEQKRMNIAEAERIYIETIDGPRTKIATDYQAYKEDIKTQTGNNPTRFNKPPALLKLIDELKTKRINNVFTYQPFL